MPSGKGEGEEGKEDPKGCAKGPEGQKTERENDVRYCLERADCARVRSPVQPRETLTPERTVLLDAEAAAKIFLAIALFFRR